MRHVLSVANDKIWKLPELIAFLEQNQNQEITLDVNPEAHCLRSCGIYDIVEKFNFSKVTIITSNALETHPTYHIIHRTLDTFFLHWKHYNLDSSGQWNQKKVFGTFYGRPSANRIGIASHLFFNYPAQSEIRIATGIDSSDTRVLYELDKLFEYDVNSVVKFSKLIKEFTFAGVDYTPMGHLFNYNTPLNELYQNILIDIISEPNIKGNTFYPTEKVVRPMLLKKPFIAMASRDYLDYLHQMGFYTFNEFWNEEYDGFEAADRYVRILKLIDHIASKSINELNDMYDQMAFQLNHNYTLIVKSLYSTKITQI